MQYKKILFTFLSFILFVSTITVSWYFYSHQQREEAVSITIQETSEEVSPLVKKTTYYVVVTALNSDLNLLSLSELQQKEIYATTVLQFPDLLNFKLVADNNSLQQLLYEEPGSVGIVAFSDLTSQMKVIPVDGQNIFADNFDLETYYLKKTVEVSEQDLSLSFDPQKLTRVVTTGEIILARGVAERIEKYQDVFYPFHKMKSYLESADLTISTLEAPIYSQCRYCDDCMVFCGKPEYLEGLSYAGIDGVTMAANHIRDFGDDAILETQDALDSLGISYFGAGMNYEQAHKPWIATVNGIKFGFLGYNDVVPENYAATESNGGSAWANVAEIQSDVEKLRSQVDVLILLPHWGIEYTNVPSARQQEVAHAAFDAGVDIIIGDHPHWVQGVEFYNNHFVIYSVGNFVFDQMWSQETHESVVLDLYFYEDQLKQVRFNPIIIEDYIQPRFATESESEVILNRIWEESFFDN